ncbi:MAG: hypothetical protein K6A41_01500 [Bacteroidales bacterium]|nr:hypothetical protein [Bacteroidales bacterium]
MFYSLKKRIICKTLAKRNKQNPFDYQKAESYSLEGEKDTLINNSYYFSAHNEKMSFFARLGKRVHMDETWFVIYVDGKPYSLLQETFPVGTSPLRVEKIGDNWTVSFHGKLNETDEVNFKATFVGKQKPIDFTSDMPAERMAAGIANEKWNKSFFEQLQNVSGQCHYEQEGVLEGQLTLNGKTVDFSLPCVRDHSFGKRDWNYMNNHLWLMAVSSARQFNYSLVSYPVMSALEVGNYRDETGLHFMLQADLDFQKINKGAVPQELDLHVKLDDSRSIDVKAKVLDGLTYHFQDGQYILHENIAEFTIDGSVCRGILEIGFNANNNRYFNQIDLKNIKR